MVIFKIYIKFNFVIFSIFKDIYCEGIWGYSFGDICFVIFRKGIFIKREYFEVFMGIFNKLFMGIFNRGIVFLFCNFF